LTARSDATASAHIIRRAGPVYPETTATDRQNRQMPSCATFRVPPLGRPRGTVRKGLIAPFGRSSTPLRTVSDNTGPNLNALSRQHWQ